MIIEGNYGPVLVTKGHHKGKVGFYDDDDDMEGKGLVYFEHPTLGAYVVLPFSSLEIIRGDELWGCLHDSLNATHPGDVRHLYREGTEVSASAARSNVKFTSWLMFAGWVSATKKINVEALAALEHEQWAHWTKHMLEVLEPLFKIVDERAYMEEEMAAVGAALRWKRQIETPYAELSEDEKESDRVWARKIAAIL